MIFASMFGLNVEITALLFNVIVVQGKVFREDLQDKNYFEHYQSINSDFPRSVYFDSALESFKTDFDVGPELLKLMLPYHSSRFIYGGNMVRDWFPKLTNPDYKQPVGPIHHADPIRPTSPDRYNGQGRIGYPVRRKPGINDRNKMCQNVKGLPTPESGCCGVQVTRNLRQRYHNPNKPRRSKFQGDRFRRSADNQEPPMKTIKGGRATDLHHLPWMAHLIINPRQPDLHRPQTCGATIISSRFVLTAAHCLYNTFKDISQLDVILAEYDTDTHPKDCIERAGEKVCIRNEAMKVDHVRLHENYNDTYLNNDIALLRLISDIPYTQFIRPICLPTADIEDLQNEDILIAGWGMNGNTESHLKQVAYVNYVSNDKCKEQYPYKDDSMFCSIGDHGEDICNGDSGGPLMVVLDKQYFLSGIVNGKAKNNGCGTSFSSLFNNVFYHKDWIVKHVNQERERKGKFKKIN